MLHETIFNSSNAGLCVTSISVMLPLPTDSRRSPAIADTSTEGIRVPEQSSTSSPELLLKSNSANASLPETDSSRSAALALTSTDASRLLPRLSTSKAVLPETSTAATSFQAIFSSRSAVFARTSSDSSSLRLRLSTSSFVLADTSSPVSGRVCSKSPQNSKVFRLGKEAIPSTEAISQFSVTRIAVTSSASAFEMRPSLSLSNCFTRKAEKSGSGISTYSSSKEPPGFPLSSPVPVPPAGSEHPASQRHDEANNSQMLLFICSIGFKVKKYDSQETFPAGEFRPEKS